MTPGDEADDDEAAGASPIVELYNGVAGVGAHPREWPDTPDDAEPNDRICEDCGKPKSRVITRINLPRPQPQLCDFCFSERMILRRNT